MNDKVSVLRDKGGATGSENWIITRRVFLKSSLAGLVALPLSCAYDKKPVAGRSTVRFGIVTDCHYTNVDTAGTRFYRESFDKLIECVKLMNAEKVDFLIELGDFKDQGKPPDEEKTLVYLQTIEKVLQDFEGPTYHVLGNHDMDSISKEQFLTQVENTGIASGRSYYSFDVKGLHCIVLDPNFKADGADYDHGNYDWTDANIAPAELNWLEQDLASAPGPSIIFIHQLLDGTGNVYVKNAADVRRILEKSGKVPIVFQGHHHPGSYKNINGIHYYTLKAMVEGSGPQNSSYAIVEIRPDYSITVTGYRKAVSSSFAGSAAAKQSEEISC